MKTGMEKNMEEIFRLSDETKSMIEVINDDREVTPVQKMNLSDDDVMDDYQYARENLKSIIESAQQSLMTYHLLPRPQNLLERMKSCQH